MNRPSPTEAARSRMGDRRKRAYGLFERFAALASRGSGSSAGFVLAAGVVVAWAVSGPMFGFSDGWQLVINTGTTIVTFLMVFLIQSSQNRDGAAIQAKLDELIRSTAKAKDAYIGIEDLGEEELQDLRALCRRAKNLDAKVDKA